MKILFLGLFYDEEGLQQSYKEIKGGVQMAPHRFQTLLIDGLRENGVEVQAVNVMPGGTFPLHHRRLFIQDKHWGEGSLRIGYFNLPLVKQWTQARKAYVAMKRALTSENPPDAIVCYYIHKPFLQAIARIKKQFPHVKTVLIMTEAVPGRGDIVDTPRRKKLGDSLVEKSKVLDGFCLLTKYLTEPMEVGDRKYFVLEGIADANMPKAAREKTKDKVFLYTGSIYKQFNLDVLIDAFAFLPEAQLWLCGNTNEEKANIEKTPNVHYFGEVPFEELKKYREQSAFLINPRQPTGTYTRYSFPSKTMEYLASGIPTVGYKLEGLGEEYYPHINFVEGADAKSLAEELRALMGTSYQALSQKAERAREFVLSEKTAKKQAAKLQEFIENL